MKKDPISKEDRALIDKMKSAMKLAESGPKGYYAVNRTKSDKAKTTYAFGLYQFLPAVHFDDMKKMAEKYPEYGIKSDSIPSKKEFNALRENGKTEEIEKKLKPLLGNKLFQDKYYDTWMMNDVIPAAKKTYDEYGKDLDYSLEQVLSLSHIMGSAGAKAKLKEAKSDPTVLDKPIGALNPASPNKYTKKFVAEIVKQGGIETRPEKFDPKGVATNPDLKKRYDDIRFRKDLDDDDRKAALDNFYSDIKTEGLTRELDDIINKEQQQIKDFQEGKTPGGRVHNLIKNTKLGENELGGLQKNDKGNKQKVYFDYRQDEKEIDAFIESLPEDKRSLVKKDNSPGAKNRRSRYYIQKGSDWNNFLEIADKEYRNISGENLYLEPNNKSSNKFVGISIDNKDLKNIDDSFNLNNLTNRPQWDTVIDRDQELKDIEEKIAQDKSDADNSSGSNSSSNDKTVKDNTPQKEVDESIGNFNRKAEEQFGDFLDKEELIVPDTFEYDENNFDKELPIAALGQGALGLIGLGAAKEELPLRDEQVSEAILNFAKTNKKLSEMGLRPEEEAAMKSDVADAYQQGMSELVRASGGNRNIVAGNASSLNLNRLKGISNIALADIQRKDAAFARYGETLQYIENFNTNRDVANHGIKLGDAQQKRTAGAQLASSGFAGMIEELQFQKENGPGSANHMLRQQLMYSSFGVVPGMKDDGTGNSVGTVSYNEKQKQGIIDKNNENNSENETNRAFRNKMSNLTDEEKSALEKSDFFKKVQNKDVRKNWTETGILSLPEEKKLPLTLPNSETGLQNLLPNSEIQEQLKNSKPAEGMSGFLA